MASELKQWLAELARELGFADCRITTPNRIAAARDGLEAFVAAGRHGDMQWLADNTARRSDPRTLWPATRSVVLTTTNYGPASDPIAALEDKHHGAISCYAQGKDYHRIIKPRLVRLAQALDIRTNASSRVFVDTAPLMEKPLAAAAGLGWQGKHTNLVTRSEGSWTFIGAILTSAELAPDQPESDHCGSCQRCLSICPTDAFPKPYQLDARRCISYLTIEHKGHISRSFRHAIGNRIFGCDDCLAVCPWNKYARNAEEIRLHPRSQTKNPPIGELLLLDENAFRAKFQGTPVMRAGRNRFMRNVLIAAGNSADTTLIPSARVLLQDPSPLVRLAAVWCLKQLMAPAAFARLKKIHYDTEEDEEIREEWSAP